MSDPPPTTTTVTEVSKGTTTALMVVAAIPLFIFHLGAAYLSYQKYHSILWALLDFVFAYFYYPYYSFFLSGVPATPPPMMGGVKLAKMLGKLMK